MWGFHYIQPTSVHVGNRYNNFASQYNPHIHLKNSCCIRRKSATFDCCVVSVSPPSRTSWSCMTALQHRHYADDVPCGVVSGMTQIHQEILFENRSVNRTLPRKLGQYTCYIAPATTLPREACHETPKTYTTPLLHHCSAARAQRKCPSPRREPSSVKGYVASVLEVR